MRRKTDLNKLLRELDKEELIAEIEKICDKFEVVKDYFQIDLTGDTAQHVAQAKKKISAQFYTKEGKPRNAKPSRLNKIIADFELLSIYKEDIIQLLLFRVTATIDFILNDDCGTMSLLSSNLRAFARACTLIADEGLQEKYKGECKALNEKAGSIYWDGTFAEIYRNCFE